MPSLAAIYLKNNLLNINKATRIAEELAKVNVTLFLWASVHYHHNLTWKNLYCYLDLVYFRDTNAPEMSVY